MDFPKKGPVMPSFDVCFVVRLNKLFNKQLTCRWFEIQQHSYIIVRMKEEHSNNWCTYDYKDINP